MAEVTEVLEHKEVLPTFREDKLVLFDVDETLLIWEAHIDDACFNGGGAIKWNIYPRPNAVELLENTAKLCKIALFSTGEEAHLAERVGEHFGHIDFVCVYGKTKVTMYKDKKAKDIALFKETHDLSNILLVDDKPRNARMHPDNFMWIAPPYDYMKKGKFDEELYMAERNLRKWIQSEKTFKEIDMTRWNSRKI